MNKQEKISRMVDMEVDQMSMDELRFNLKFLYRESYDTYTDREIGIMYEQMMSDSAWSNDENEEERKGEYNG
jgi:hypothetical protein